MNKILCSLVIVGFVSITGSNAWTQDPATDKAVEVVETVEIVEAVESGNNVELVVEDVAPITNLEPMPLSQEDCVKCHYGVAVDVDANGVAHKDLDCMECHEEHPPAGTNIIPECATCHDEGDNDHYAGQGCAKCHNPHHPLLIDFTALDNAASVCAGCHQDQIDELAANPSAHSEQDCNSCHNQHGLAQGQSQTCLDCHDGHTEKMTKSDCLACHAPHSPINIVYGDDVEVALCAGCHEEVAETLATSGTMHSEMGCGECHSGQHKNIIACVDCHDQPHDEYMHTKFPECIACHRDPHNLAK